MDVFRTVARISAPSGVRFVLRPEYSKIEKLNPEGWTRDQLAGQLDRALAVVEHAEDEYGQAAEHFAKTRSASIFQGVRRARRSGGEFTQQLLRGFAFNLPVLALGGVALLVYLFR